MKVRSRLFQQILEVFLPQEFSKHISRSRSRQRKDDLALACQALAQSLRDGRYLPGEPMIIRPKGQAKDRRLCIFPLRDRILLRAIHRGLAGRLNPRLLTDCIGGVKGRSRHDALKVLALAQERGLPWAVKFDVANFFASVDQAALDRQLSGLGIPSDVRRLVAAFLVAACPGGKGIPLGLPSGKLLANACLNALDCAVAARGLPWCRFVDDVLVMAPTRNSAEAVMQTLRGEADKLGLATSEPKSGIFHRYRGGFDFLGFRVNGRFIGPSEEAVSKFRDGTHTLAASWRGGSLTGLLRRFNRRILGFGHMYRGLDVARLYRRLDSTMAAEFRQCLARSAKATDLSGCFRQPGRFPANLAFPSASLRDLGLARFSALRGGRENAPNLPAATPLALGQRGGARRAHIAISITTPEGRTLCRGRFPLELELLS